MQPEAIQAATKCLGGNVFHDVSHTFCFDSMSALPPRIKTKKKQEEEDGNREERGRPPYNTNLKSFPAFKLVL